MNCHFQASHVPVRVRCMTVLQRRARRRSGVSGMVGGWNAIGMTRKIWKVGKANTKDLHTSKKEIFGMMRVRGG
jgi:hypothetical protein